MINKMTHAKSLTLNDRTIELAKKNCLGIFLNVNVEIANGGSSDTKIPVEKVLEKIRFNVKKNNKTALVEMDAFKIALLNVFDANGYFNIDGTISIPKENTTQLNVPLYIDGPFRAEDYTSFDISMDVNQSINDNVTINSVTAEVTAVYTDEKLDDAVIERTKNIFKTSFQAGSYQEAVHLNTLNSIQQAIVIIRDKTGKRSDKIVKKIGIRSIGTEKTDIMELGYKSALMINKMQFSPKTQPTGVIFIDFRTELTGDNWGIKAWRLGQDKLYLALEAEQEGTIEVLTKELIVNTSLIDKADEQPEAEFYPEYYPPIGTTMHPMG